MKKYIFMLLLLLLLCLLSACVTPQFVNHSKPAEDAIFVDPMLEEEAGEKGDSEESPNAAEKESVFELALITDGGDVTSGGMNQSAWEGVAAYGAAFDVSCLWYQPEEASTTAFSASIAEAVKNGARLVICSGPLFEAAVYEAQYAYPETSFICIDCSPTSSTGDEQCASNVYSMYFNEEQIGFLAGYSAVMEGYTRLGFLGAMAIPSIMGYQAGFLQGLDQASRDRGVEVEVIMGYTGGFMATAETQNLASTWYLNNTQCIFACGGEIASSVMVAAEAAGTVVICSDFDLYRASDSVVTSAIKNIKTSVFNGINAFYTGTFPGGQILELSAGQSAVALAMDHARFVNFTKNQHNELLTLLGSGELNVRSVDSTNPDWAALVSPSVTIHME
ncbi:MAG: BMP family ABC transporter substrate-binding protein [Bacillota bacterium]|nr:BMP family ABC transporter substrate-binding protein [Bacillota bacterium]